CEPFALNCQDNSMRSALERQRSSVSHFKAPKAGFIGFVDCVALALWSTRPWQQKLLTRKPIKSGHMG
ncbi:MAG: hypothetical protein OIF58_08555, partial [Cohaesibacter sp.]|nr:hypothetical protein [Cohaesibacter sp.]